MSFRWKNDTRDPPMRPGEKLNDVSKRTGLPLRCFRCNSKYHYDFRCPNASSADKVHFSQVLEAGSEQDSPEQEGMFSSYFTSTSTAHLCEVSSNDVFLAKGNAFLGCCVDTGVFMKLLEISSMMLFAKKRAWGVIH
jgi:hypothetical protein